MSKLLEIDYKISDINTVAKLILEHCNSKTLLFSGDMGTGKTTLITSLVKLLGSNDEVSSPTFSIVNEYRSVNEKIYHFDLFRIDSDEELLNFGFEEYLQDTNWVFIEWPQIATDLFVDHVNFVEILYSDSDSRLLKLSK